MTPDSSRFWPADKYQPGRDQESFDKQFVRNYLEEIKFDKSGPGVKLPDDVVKKTGEKYIEATNALRAKNSGSDLAAFRPQSIKFVLSHREHRGHIELNYKQC